MRLATSRTRLRSLHRRQVCRTPRRHLVARMPQPVPGMPQPITPQQTTVYAELERERRRTAELEHRVHELSRSMRELEAFASEISHDLKAPLASICGYAQLLTHLNVGDQCPREYDEFVAEISRGTDRMRLLIDDVLAYSTVTGVPLHVTAIDLATLVDDVVTDRTVGRPRTAPQFTRDALPAVRGDHGMLRRLLENLLGNAVKYVRPGDAAQVHVSARTDGGFVRVEVTDRGIGIPEGQHEEIFGELHRAHSDAYPGTGLGLSICRRIVQRLGGAIGADPLFRGGARIWFTLPVAGPAAAPTAATDAGDSVRDLALHLRTA